MASCSANRPKPVIVNEIVLDIPDSLRKPCTPMGMYPSDIEGMAIVHGVNMENAGKCRLRHEAIIGIVERAEEKYSD